MRYLICLIFVVVLSGCSDNTAGENTSATDNDNDNDTETKNETPIGTDTNANSDTGSQAHNDTGSDSQPDTGSDRLDTHSETASDTAVDTNPNTASDTIVDTHPDPDSETQVDPGDDLCPDDPNKTEPGVCGCGVADIDSDGDGVLDCNEEDDQVCGRLGPNVDTSKEKYASQMCCLCEDCEFSPEERWSTYVDSNQTTCADIEFDIFDAEPGSETCFGLQREYRNLCCNTECTPPVIEQEWDPVEPVFPEGDYQNCHLCKNGQYPLLPWTITAIAYVPGNPTCDDLYWLGRTRNLPEAMCYPIQNYMEEPCGCLPPGPEERPRGDEPLCDICPDGQYPLRGDAVPNDIDAPVNTSCVDLYWMGRTGNISTELCKQIHGKAQDACGCLPAE